MSTSLKTVGADADAYQASRFASRAQAPTQISPDAKASALRVRRGGIRESSWGTDPSGKSQAVISSWQPLRKTRQIRAAQSRSRLRQPFFRCRQAAGVSDPNPTLTQQAEPAKTTVSHYPLDIVFQPEMSQSLHLTQPQQQLGHSEHENDSGPLAPALRAHTAVRTEQIHVPPNGPPL